MLLSELTALLDNKALPLLEQAYVDVGKEKRHESVLLLICLNNRALATLEVSLKLHHCREVLFQYDRCDEICSLSKQQVVLLF